MWKRKKPAGVNQRAFVLLRAADGIRTHDNHVGNVMLYQLSYSRLRLLEEQEISNTETIGKPFCELDRKFF